MIHSSSSTGPVALVLGATGRIGSSISRQLAAAGLRVALQYRTSTATAHRLRAELDRPDAHSLVPADLDVPGALDRLFAQVTQESGTPAVLVNAVHCQFTPRPAASATWDVDWAPHVRAMQVHVEACRLAVAGMRAQRYGRIVLVSGALAARPLRGCGAYAAVKAGLQAFHRVLALEEGAHGITVNAVAPGRVEPDDGRTATDDPHVWAPLNDSADPASALPADPSAREVAAAVAFLASPEAAAMTGQVLYLARGQVMAG